jgi:alpha-L-fucosidase 2
MISLRTKRLCHRALPLLAGLLFLAVAHPARAQDSTNSLTLWYTHPAGKWTEALPIGNGRLGAMIFGGANREHLQLNEDTLWAGGPYQPDNTNAFAALAKVRQLVFAGQYDAASKMIGDRMMARPVREMPYESLGDLFLDFPTNQTATDYRRELNLDTAVARVSYTSGGVKFTREMFASAPDQVIVIRLTADRPGQISFTAGLQTPQTATTTVEFNTNQPLASVTNDATLVMSGINGSYSNIAGALKFQARVRLLPSQGKITASANTITVTGADSVTLLIAAATSYKNYHDVTGDPVAITRKQINHAYAKWFNGQIADGIDTTLADHIADYQRLFQRVALNLGSSGDAAALPTDERIAHFNEGKDPELAALYFQFARYLLISSSRPGGQAANLQGLWNDSLNPPWGSKYTININTEMNYWPAETANLSECVEPLTALVMDLTRTGARTARVQYHARGWVAHHNTDLWRAAAPVDGPNSGMWPLGGAWLCQNLWEHYQFTQDPNYLKRIYPAMKGAAQFFLDTLVEEPTHHWLVTCPSLSPENKHPEGKTSICAGPTMDLELLRDLFSNCLRAEQILNRDQAFGKQLAATRDRLAPLQIGSAGQLQEWLQDWDMEAPEIHHRHVSHLYGLYPSAQIDLRATPELAAAVKKSLEIRGDQATGWATAWRINLWARLHDGGHAYRILEFLLSPQRTYPDMFDAHPPFQIDGNFGGASGIAEMLLQSQNDTIEFLPALPPAWPTGSVSGLRARGGFVVDLTWLNQKLTAVTLHSLAGTNCHLRYGDLTRDVTMKKGASLQLNGNLE